MDAQELERLLERLMKQDFSVGTEAFRDALLERCLAVLDSGEEVACLDDETLEMLSAAGSFPAGIGTAFGDNESDDYRT